jgi:hypothetical protein
MPAAVPPVAKLESLTPAMAAEVIRIRANGRPSPGLGRRQKLVSFLVGGRRIVVVGHDQFYTLHPEITFHDFLQRFMQDVTGGSWGKKELAKPYDERHPILQWHEDNANHWQELRKTMPKGTLTVEPTGRMAAMYTFAYDLLTVANNNLLDAKLLGRLRHPDQFQGARYELRVRAHVLRSGMKIELEDEDKRGVGGHTEFIANHESGTRYNVEAKSRHRSGYLGHPGDKVPVDQIQLDFGVQLSQALAKPAQHQRMVFLELNIPPSDPGEIVPSWHGLMDRIIKKKEQFKLQDGSRLPPCILVLTNQPFHFGDRQDRSPGDRTIIAAFNTPGYRALSTEQAEAKYPVVKDLKMSALLRMPSIFLN